MSIPSCWGAPTIHFPRPVIEDLMGPGVKIVDSRGPCTVASLLEQMDRGRVIRASGREGRARRVMTTGDVGKVHAVASALWSADLPEVEVVSLAAGQ